MSCSEEQDQAHAAEVARKLKEEEDIQMALRMQDEAMAKKMQEAEAKRYVCIVEPPDRGHFGASHFVLCWEVVPSLEGFSLDLLLYVFFYTHPLLPEPLPLIIMAEVN